MHAARELALLANYRQWVAWRYEGNSGSKLSKVPYNPRTLTPASVTSPATWASYEDAATVDGFDGIGFVFTEGDPFTIIDLDDCLDEFGLIVKDCVNDVIQSFASYTEVSPSGRGLRIIVEGQWERKNQTKGNWGGSFEIYSSKRYATITGETFGKPEAIRNGQGGLDFWAPRFGSRAEFAAPACFCEPKAREPKSNASDDVSRVLAQEWPVGERSDKMIEAENGMLHLPPEERYLHLRTNTSFCDKMDDRGGPTGWDFYLRYVCARTGNLDKRFTERKGGTAPRTPRELIEGRRQARILLDHELEHPDSDHHTHVMLIDTLQQALKHGDLRSAATNPRDDVATRHWLTQDGHHDFLHRAYHPKYEVKSIGHQGCKTVVNLLTRRAEQIIACHDRHHGSESESSGSLREYPSLDTPHVEDTPEQAWHRLLTAQRRAKQGMRWALVKHYNECIDACLPKSAIRASTWNGKPKERTPLGTSNDFQNAQQGWVRVRRTNAYIDIRLPPLDTFLRWEEEARLLRARKRRSEPNILGPGPSSSPQERLRELKRISAKRSRLHDHPTTCGPINRRLPLPGQPSTEATQPSRGPPNVPPGACQRFQETKLKHPSRTNPIGRGKDGLAR